MRFMLPVFCAGVILSLLLPSAPLCAASPGTRIYALPENPAAGFETKLKQGRADLSNDASAGAAKSPALKIEAHGEARGYVESRGFRITADRGGSCKLAYMSARFLLKCSADFQGEVRIALYINGDRGKYPHEVGFEHFKPGKDDGREVDGFTVVNKSLCAVNSTHPNLRATGGRTDGCRIRIYLDNAKGTVTVRELTLTEAAPGEKGFSGRDWDRFESGDGKHWFFAMHSACFPIYSRKHGQFSPLVVDTGLKLAAVAGWNGNREFIEWGPNHRFVTCQDIWHPITNSNPDVKAGAGNADYEKRLDFLLSLVENMEYYGMRVLLCIQGSPDWSHPGFTNDIKGRKLDLARDHAPTVKKYGRLYPGPQYARGGHWLYPPDHWSDWRDFAEALTRKLKGRKVIYEIINEINVNAQGAVIGGYKAVSQWVTHFHQVAKEIDPDCEVIVGSCDKMLAGLVADGVLKHCDGVAFHGYTGDLHGTRGIVESGGQMKHIWMTEGHGLRPEYRGTTRGNGKWTVFSVLKGNKKLNDHKLIEVRDATGALANPASPPGKGDRVTVKKNLEFDKKTPSKERYSYYTSGYHTGRFAKGNIDGTAKNTDRISARVHFANKYHGTDADASANGFIYGQTRTVFLVAQNNSKKTFRNVRLWPVGFVENLGFDLERVRGSDKTIAVFAPGQKEMIRMDVTPTTTQYKAGGTYDVGLAIFNRERKHSLALRSLKVVERVADKTPPVIAEPGLKTDGITHTTVRLKWTGATDSGGTPANALTYKLYKARTANIYTVRGAEKNGALVATVTGKEEYLIKHLAHSTTYYVNVVVQDTAGNKSCYTMLKCATAQSSQTTPPEPGGQGAITVRKATRDEVFAVFDHPDSLAPRLSWNAATSWTGREKKAGIVYWVYQSQKGALDTLEDIAKHGRLCARLKGQTHFVVIGLGPGKRYRFNVVAVDEVGNRAPYDGTTYSTSVP